MHGGELKLENNSPQGIIAKIFLPFEIIAIEKEGNEENLKQKEPSLNILVAEDNMTNQKVITLILNQLGYEVTTASDGSLCIETLGTQNFDLILMDLHMPYMDGYEATRRIRAAGVFRLIIRHRAKTSCGVSFLPTGLSKRLKNFSKKISIL